MDHVPQRAEYPRAPQAPSNMGDRKRQLDTVEQIPNLPPMTFSVMTYNLWKTDGEPTSFGLRRPILLRQLAHLQPDVMMVQELHPKLTEMVNEALPHHRSVGDPRDPTPALTEKGWVCEGNIFWRKSLFTEVEHGALDIGQQEPDRRLFWVRLMPMGGDTRTLLFATAHFT